MKKFILTLAAAAMTMGMYAAEVTINMADLDPANIQGTYVETTYKADGTSVQAWGHYQPLTGFTAEGYTFAFADGGASTAPALYDTETVQHVSLRLYKNNTMTITAPEGTTFTKIAYQCEGSYYKPLPTPSVGTITNEGRINTWENAEGVSSVTFTLNGQNRITYFIITDDAEVGGGDDPETPEVTEGLNADFSTGKCNFTWEDGTLPEGLTYVWTIDNNNGYMKASGYKSGTSYEVEGAYLVSPVFTLEGLTQAKALVNEAFGPASYTAEDANSCFSVCIRENGGEWQPVGPVCFPADTQKWAFVDNLYSLSAYDGKSGLQLGFKYTSTSAGAPTWEIKTVNVTGQKESESGVKGIATENGAAQYYNLQGVRVANPERGLFIKVQDGKASKVIL